MTTDTDLIRFYFEWAERYRSIFHTTGDPDEELRLDLADRSYDVHTVADECDPDRYADLHDEWVAWYADFLRLMRIDASDAESAGNFRRGVAILDRYLARRTAAPTE